MKRIILAFCLLFSAQGWADNYCSKLNENSYKTESRVDPPGAIYIVQKGRAFFFSAPDLSCRTDAFVISGNKVQVYTEYNGFVSVMYLRRDGSSVEGWLEIRRLTKTFENSAPREGDN